MTKVKICGITNLEDARLCQKLGADALGYNFYKRSKRYVMPSRARSISDQLDETVSKFGIFVNEKVEDILKAANLAKIDVIQLHGEESPEFIANLRKEANLLIVKAFRVASDFDRSILEDYDLDGVLLDSYSEKEHGGSGKTFDWSRVAAIANGEMHVYLAGGLGPHNVAEAIKTVRPFAVDVASGVETAPGKKDSAKLEAFIANAKRA